MAEQAHLAPLICDGKFGRAVQAFGGTVDLTRRLAERDGRPAPTLTIMGWNGQLRDAALGLGCQPHSTQPGPHAMAFTIRPILAAMPRGYDVILGLDFLHRHKMTIVSDQHLVVTSLPGGQLVCVDGAPDLHTEAGHAAARAVRSTGPAHARLARDAMRADTPSASTRARWRAQETLNGRIGRAATMTTPAGGTHPICLSQRELEASGAAGEIDAVFVLGVPAAGPTIDQPLHHMCSIAPGDITPAFVPGAGMQVTVDRAGAVHVARRAAGTAPPSADLAASIRRYHGGGGLSAADHGRLRTHLTEQQAFVAAVATSDLVDDEPGTAPAPPPVAFTDAAVEARARAMDRAFRDKHRAARMPDDLPAGLPLERDLDHKIDLTPGAQPTHRSARPMSAAELVELSKFLTEMTKLGFVRESKSPYSAPILFVVKKDGTMRLVVDYRALNEVTVKNRYAMPLVGTLFDQLAGAKFFSKLDLRSGYYQIRVAAGDEPKTAFATRYGHYEFTVLPMGLCNAPATFMHLMQSTFRDELDKFVLCYLDDILVYSLTLEQHLEDLEVVMQRLTAARLFAKESKCDFFRPQVEFLGHLVGQDGLSMMDDKVHAIMHWPTPTTQKDVEQFLGLSGYYRAFIQGYSRISAPMAALTGIRTANPAKPNPSGPKPPFAWTEVHQQSFDALKAAVTAAPCLILADHTKPFEVHTDASGYATGAVLMQDHGKGLQPIAFMSKKMTGAETRYTTRDQEFLAITQALKMWRHYLHGTHFVVRTDHQSLQYLRTAKMMSGRQHRWEELFADFNFTIRHIAGATNPVPDALSRGAAGPHRVATVATDHMIYAIHGRNGHYEQRIRAAARRDPAYAALLGPNAAPLRAAAGLQLRGQFLYRLDGAIAVPANAQLRTDLLEAIHCDDTAGHLGRDVTVARARGRFHWPGISLAIRSFVDGCEMCARTKPPNHKPHGSPQPLDIPAAPWDTVTIDFVGPLPVTTAGNDMILVCVDKLTKMTIYTPHKSSVTALGTTQLLMDTLIRRFGVPRAIVSDRDVRFTSAAWTSFWGQLHTELRMSNAYHPQSDGQTERANRTMLQILRSTVDTTQTDWDTKLAAAEIAVNSAMQASTGVSPYHLNHGREMHLAVDNALPANALRRHPAGVAAAEHFQHLHTAIRDRLAAAQVRQTKAMATHLSHHTYRVGDKVWLSTEHLRPVGWKRSPKLADLYVGPFAILSMNGPNSLRLALPAHWTIHNGVNTDRVKPHVDGSASHPLRRPLFAQPGPLLVMGADDGAEQEEYEVKAVLGHRFAGARLQYRVQWKGYSLDEATWVGIADMQHCARLIRDYRRRTEHGEALLLRDRRLRAGGNRPVTARVAGAPVTGPPHRAHQSHTAAGTYRVAAIGDATEDEHSFADAAVDEHARAGAAEASAATRTSAGETFMGESNAADMGRRSDGAAAQGVAPESAAAENDASDVDTTQHAGRPRTASETDETIARLLDTAPSTQDFRQAADAAPSSVMMPLVRITDPLATFWERADEAENRAPAGYLESAYGGTWHEYMAHLVAQQTPATAHDPSFPPLLRTLTHLRDIVYHLGHSHPQSDGMDYVEAACHLFAGVAFAAEQYGPPPTSQLVTRLNACYRCLIALAPFTPGTAAHRRHQVGRCLTNALNAHQPTISDQGPGQGGIAILEVADITVAILTRQATVHAALVRMAAVVAAVDREDLRALQISIVSAQNRATTSTALAQRIQGEAATRDRGLQAQRDARRVVEEATALVDGDGSPARPLSPSGRSRDTAAIPTDGAAPPDPMCTAICSHRARYGDLCDKHLRTDRHLAIRRSDTPGAGMGLFTSQALAAGDAAAWLSGRVLTSLPADTGLQRWCFQLTPTEWIDTSSRGTSVGRFINHDAAPNCCIVDVDSGARRTAILRTLSHVPAETELTIAYAAWGIALCRSGATHATASATSPYDLAMARIVALNQAMDDSHAAADASARVRNAGSQQRAADTTRVKREVVDLVGDEADHTSGTYSGTPMPCCVAYPHAATVGCIPSRGTSRRTSLTPCCGLHPHPTSMPCAYAGTTTAGDAEAGLDLGTEGQRMALSQWFPTTDEDAVEGAKYVKPASDTPALKAKRDSRRKARRLVEDGTFTEQLVADYLAGKQVGAMTAVEAGDRRRNRTHTMTQAEAAGNALSDHEYGVAGKRQRAAARRANPALLDAGAATALLPRAGSAYAPLTVLECRAAARYTLNDPKAKALLATSKYRADKSTDAVSCDAQRCSHTPSGPNQDPDVTDTDRCRETALLGDLCSLHLDTDMGFAIRRSTHPMCWQEWGLFTTRPFHPYERLGAYAGDRVRSDSHGPYVAADTRGLTPAQLNSDAACFGIDAQRSNAGYMRLINDAQDFAGHHNNACLYSGRYDDCAWAAVRALAGGIPANTEVFMAYGPHYFSGEDHQAIDPAAALGAAVTASGITQTDINLAFVASEDSFRSSGGGGEADDDHHLVTVPADPASAPERGQRRSARAITVAARAEHQRTALAASGAGVGALYPDAPTLANRDRPPPLAGAALAAAEAAETAVHTAVANTGRAAKKRPARAPRGAAAKRVKAAAGASRRSSGTDNDDTGGAASAAASEATTTTTTTSARGRTLRQSQQATHAAESETRFRTELDDDDDADAANAAEAAAYRITGATLTGTGLNAAAVADLHRPNSSAAVASVLSATPPPPLRTARSTYLRERQAFIILAQSDQDSMDEAHKFQGTTQSGGHITDDTWDAFFNVTWCQTHTTVPIQ